MPSHPWAGRWRGSRRGTSAPAGRARRAPGRRLRTPTGRVLAWGAPSVHEVKIIPERHSAKPESAAGGEALAVAAGTPAGSARRGDVSGGERAKPGEANSSPPSALYPNRKQPQPKARALLFPDGHGNPDGELPSLRSPHHPVPLCSRRDSTGARRGGHGRPCAAASPRRRGLRLLLPPRPCPAGPAAPAAAPRGCPGQGLPHSRETRSASPLNAPAGRAAAFGLSPPTR